MAAIGNVAGILGCDNGDTTASKRCNQAARLTDNSFSYLGRSFAFHRIDLGSDGFLEFQVDITTSERFRSELTLHIDGVQFPLADATESTIIVSNDAIGWANAGVSWSVGDTVELKLTRPPFIGVELFGGDLVPVTDGAPTLTVAEGGSATFMVKLSEQPTASVTVSVGKGQIRCPGCGGNWHDDINAGEVSPTTMTFTSTNWNVGQTVTVTGVADDDSVHEHFQALVYVSSTTSTTPGDPFRSPDGALGAYVTVTDGSDDGTQHGGL